MDPMERKLKDGFVLDRIETITTHADVPIIREIGGDERFWPRHLAPAECWEEVEGAPAKARRVVGQIREMRSNGAPVFVRVVDVPVAMDPGYRASDARVAGKVGAVVEVRTTELVTVRFANCPDDLLTWGHNLTILSAGEVLELLNAGQKALKAE